MNTLEPDAISVAIRGFQTQVAGNSLIAALNELGFEVKFCADGENDSMGGIIETAITPTITSETDEPGEIVKALQSALPGIPFSVLLTSYVLDHDEEFHVKPTDSVVPDRKADGPEFRVVGESE